MTQIQARPLLTAAQERFAIEYAVTGNQANAARAAYPSVASDSKVASERGRQLLRKPHVLARVAELKGMPQQPLDSSDLEHAAAIAFDETVPDLVRLIALRSVTAGLTRWSKRFGTAARIVVRLKVEPANAERKRR